MGFKRYLNGPLVDQLQILISKSWGTGRQVSCRRFAALVPFLLFVTGCGDLSGGIKRLAGLAIAPDFLKTQIIANDPVPANGVSELIVLIHLKNSDGSVVKDYQPTFEIASGAGVIGNNCTASTEHGVSVCILKATYPGAKLFRLTNARVGLEREVHFDPTQGAGRIMGLASGGEQKGTTAAGHQVQMSAGLPAKGLRVTTGRGYKGYFSIQGAILSE